MAIYTYKTIGKALGKYQSSASQELELLKVVTVAFMAKFSFCEERIRSINMFLP